MGLRSAVRELFRSGTGVTEAAPRALASPPKTPERAGFEYGIPGGGLTETRQGMGRSTSTDRRSLMQELYEAYLSCPWAWASINAIARTITAGGLVTEWSHDEAEEGAEAPPKPANVLAMLRLFAFCNPREDIRQLMRGVITDLLVFGDAYIEVVWVGSVPVALYSLDAPSMYPIADEHGAISGYAQITEFGQRARFEPRDVIHISLDSPRSGVFGVSPTQAMLLPITAWLFAAATAKEIFRKGNPPSIHVDFPAATAQPEITRWLAMYAAQNLGPRNIGTPIVTKGGGKVNELKQGSIQEYIDFLNQKRDEIIAGYGVPPAEAGIIESGNLGGGTGESQRKTFIANTCQPIAELVLEKIQYHIAVLGFGITDWQIKFQEVDTRASETIEKIRDLRLRNGSYTLNRARAEIGEPPVDGGNEAAIIQPTMAVLWQDLAAMSHAEVAAKAKGTDLAVSDVGDDQPIRLKKTEPNPVPPALAPFAGVAPGQPAAPGAGRHRAEPPADDMEPDTVESEFSADWRRVSAAWASEYRRRRAEALASLPDAGATLLAMAAERQ